MNMYGHRIGYIIGDRYDQYPADDTHPGMRHSVQPGNKPEAGDHGTCGAKTEFGLMAAGFIFYIIQCIFAAPLTITDLILLQNKKLGSLKGPELTKYYSYRPSAKGFELIICLP